MNVTLEAHIVTVAVVHAPEVVRGVIHLLGECPVDALQVVVAPQTIVWRMFGLHSVRK